MSEKTIQEIYDRGAIGALVALHHAVEEGLDEESISKEHILRIIKDAIELVKEGE